MFRPILTTTIETGIGNFEIYILKEKCGKTIWLQARQVSIIDLGGGHHAVEEQAHHLEMRKQTYADPLVSHRILYRIRRMNGSYKIETMNDLKPRIERFKRDLIENNQYWELTTK